MHLETMNKTIADMSKVLGLFTVGIRGIEGMKSNIIQQYSSSEKSAATRNSYKMICAGVIRACYHEYVRNKGLSPILSIPEKLLDTLMQCGMPINANDRKEAGTMLLGIGPSLERQDISFYLAMLKEDTAQKQ